MHKEKNISISLLIPAFDFAEGVARIINSFDEDDLGPSFKVIISDDSNNEDVNLVCNEYKHKTPFFKYVNHYPSLGAVNNWNYLLDMCDSDYLIISHHDETPLNKDFIKKVKKELANFNYPDVCVMNCIVHDEAGSISKKCTPQLIKKFIIHIFPGYLFKRNVLGAVSTIIIRRQICPRFDVNLQWFVDVDFYYRLRSATSSWKFSKSLCIGSMNRVKGSITSSLKLKLNEIKANEDRYLFNKYQDKLYINKVRHSFLYCIVDTIFWSIVRMIFFLNGLFLSKKFPLWYLRK